MIKVTIELNIYPEMYEFVGGEFDLERAVCDELFDQMREDILSACEIECFCEGCELTRNIAPAGFCKNGIGVK
jgi:hypothetical protein